MSKKYELIEHTADIGIRVKGKNTLEIFLNAAAAMFDIIAEKIDPEVARKQRISITLRAANAEELLVKWLNELLSLSATKGLIFTALRINKFSDKDLQATGYGEKAESYRIKTEIKAATYHNLNITKTRAGQKAEVIFDV